MSPTPLIQKFFERWEQIINAADDDRVASCYADPFMFADPTGARVIEKEKFVAALPRRREFFKQLGHESTKIAALRETPLDQRYTEVRVRFLMAFRKPGTERVELEVESTFILFVSDRMPQIVFHLEHESLQQAMQARGVSSGGR